MAKWKSQQYYTVQLENVLCSVVELVNDTSIAIGSKWYWGGQRDITIKSGRINGTITSLTEHVLPVLYRKDDRLMAMLPIQTVIEFENETHIQWQNGISAQVLISKVKSTYLAQ